MVDKLKTWGYKTVIVCEAYYIVKLFLFQGRHPELKWMRVALPDNCVKQLTTRPSPWTSLPPSCWLLLISLARGSPTNTMQSWCNGTAKRLNIFGNQVYIWNWMVRMKSLSKGKYINLQANLISVEGDNLIFTDAKFFTNTCFHFYLWNVFKGRSVCHWVKNDVARVAILTRAYSNQTSIMPSYNYQCIWFGFPTVHFVFICCRIIVDHSW